MAEAETSDAALSNGSDALTILPADGSEAFTYPLDLNTDDGLAVEVVGHHGDERFHVRVGTGEIALAGEVVDVSFFDLGVKRARFATTTGRLVHAVPDIEASAEDISDAIQEALDVVRSQIADGCLVVADAVAQKLLEQTTDVTSSPSAGTVTVTFEGEDLDEKAFAFDRRQMTVSAAAWTDNRPPSVPGTVDGDLDDDRSRWRACRRVWTEMTSVGEPPAATREITESVIREAGTIPGTRMAIAEFERLADEYDRLKYVWREGEGGDHRHKHLYHHAARELGLLDEFEDLTRGEVRQFQRGDLTP